MLSRSLSCVQFQLRQKNRMNNKINLFNFRSVPPSQRSYGLGIQMDLVRILGAIPGPIVFGALLDKTCILWNTK